MGIDFGFDVVFEEVVAGVGAGEHFDVVVAAFHGQVASEDGNELDARRRSDLHFGIVVVAV